MEEKAGKTTEPVASNKKTGRVMMLALIAAAIVAGSVAGFVKYSTRATEDAVHNVSLFYLEELASNVTRVFTTHFDGYFKELWLAMLATNEAELGTERALDAHLKDMAKRGDFLFYALLDEDGNVYISDERYLDNSIKATLDERDFSQEQIWVQEVDRDTVFVIAHAAPEGTEVLDGVKIVAGAKGLSKSKIEKEILLRGEDNDAYVNLIMPDGTYLIAGRNKKVVKTTNFFEDLRTHVTFNKYSLDTMIEEIQNQRNGSTAFYIDGERYYGHYVYLPRSGWSLVVTVPFSTVNAMVQGTAHRVTMGGIALMLLMMVVTSGIFVIYMKQRRENMVLDIRRLEAEERNKAKSSFLSSMSHDIRTPMNAIVGFTNLAMKQDVNPQVADYLTKISTSSSHLLGLINDVLDMSRIESGKMAIDDSECNLSEIFRGLHTIIQGQADAKQQKLCMDAIDVVNEDVWCDKMRLNQVLLNFLSNAVKFTPAGGTITMTVKQLESQNPGFGAYEFRVKDTGIGMSKGFSEKIFEPFEREHTTEVNNIQGTGLGMSIAKNIIDMMGGTVRVETELGMGTEFIVNVELRLQEGAESTQTAADEKLKGMRALIVDDDCSVCDNVIKMLYHLEMEAKLAMSDKEALWSIERIKEDGEKYDVYIIHWQRLDSEGLDVIRQIRACDEQTPILLISAQNSDSVESEAKTAGVTAVFNGPLFMSDLRSLLVETISKDSGEETNESEELDPEKFAGKKILLTDDNELNREIAVEILQGFGFIMDTAENGRIAFEKIKESVPGDYDIVLMDVQMPVMDGYEATRAIRGLDNPALARIPILAMTANAFEEDKRNALEAGMNGHLTKPIDVPVLLGVLAQLL